MVEPLKWDKIDISTHLMPNMTSFHVDTRGFHYMYTTEKLKRYEGEEDRYYDKFNKLLDMMNSDEGIDEKYLMEERRVIPFVYNIREMRTLNKTIMVRFDVPDCEYWLKYIRFYPYKGKYVVTNDCIPIEWRTLTNKTFIGINYKKE